MKFRVGDAVCKATGYKWPGIVVAAYKTLKGEERFVVECIAEATLGAQHIYNGEQLRMMSLTEYEQLQ